MGPGGPDYPGDKGDMLDAPQLTSKTDKFVYRRNVRMWYECVQSAAESGYARAMGTSKNLGHALFTRMDQRYKRIVHSAIDNGSLRLRTHPDGRKFTDQEHTQCVENILNLVAKETTTDRVKRLIRMTREVHDCKRGAKESFAEYAVRFESIARAYLSIAKAWPDSQDEQNFAIMAIENANLPIATYNAIISNLVSHAKESVRTKMAQVPVDTIRAFIADIDEMVQRMTSVNVQPQDNNHVAIQDVKQMFQSLHSKAKGIPMPLSRHGEDMDDHTISLTKALEELQDIKTEFQRTEDADGKAANNTANTGNGDTSKQVGSMMGGREDTRNKKGKNRRDRSQYNQHRNSRKRHQEQRKSSTKIKKRSHSDRQSDIEDSSSEDEDERPRNKKPNVLERLGKHDDSPRKHKKVRFNNGSREGYRHDKDENDDSDTDSYFQKADRRRS